jgi:beta-glucanase (GH16 family)
MRLCIKILLIIAFISPLSALAQNWQMVWSDEFNDLILDESIWTREVGGNGWGNNELQYYTNRTVNSFLQNGKLVIKAIEENFGSRNYTSARLKTQDKKFFKYGKIEARIKLPFGKGIWPAFWMLGQSFPVVGWPASGEIDIMELVGGSEGDNKVYGTAHWEENGQHAQYGGNYILSSGIFADDFHLFSITWDPQFLRWYVDDNLFYTFNITSFDKTEFHREFFIILNVAVGGNWPGPPDPSTVFPQRMEIDYVRVYQQITDVKADPNIPIQFELFQNYPNPFNPETIIAYSIPYDSHVNIILYNVLGEKVADLVNEVKQTGYHELLFNAANFPSGIYFYKIQARNLTSGFSSIKQDASQIFVKTKKMVLMR